MKTCVSFQTNSASRYLAMICKHFGRRFEANSEDTNGWVQFPFGRCEMTADDTQLQMVASAKDQTQLEQVMQVVTSHLERFAFRENPILEWKNLSK